jgi:hypothetical protein
MRARQPETHPDPDLLAAFAEQRLPDRERLPLLTHLSSCSACRDVLALAAEPMKSAADKAKDTAAIQKAPWLTWPVLRWGTAAACVLIVGTAVLLHRNENAKVVSLSQVEAPSRFEASSSEAAVHPLPEASVPANEKDVEKLAPNISRGKANKAVVREESKVPFSVPQRGESVVSGRRDLRDAFSYSTQAATGSMAAKESRSNGALAKVTPGAAPAGGGGSTGMQMVSSSPAAPVPAPLQAPGKKDLQNVPAIARSENGSMAHASEPVEVQSQLVDAPGSADADKEVEILGRAKPSSATASNALAIAPSDQLDRMQQGPPSTPEAISKTKRDRAKFVHSESTRWNLSSDGQLQRSIDSGKTWQPFAAPAGAAFRALSFNGPDIWVGGATGLLYHSVDAGTHWDLVKPSINGVSLSADIAAIAFTDPQHGKITTSNGETWSTADGGQSWNQSH